MRDIDFITKLKELVDSLKGVCANFGLGNDGNEFKIITQVFLYKFISDQFISVAKAQDLKLNNAKSFYDELNKKSESEYDFILDKIGNKALKLKKEHLINYLFNKQNENNFSQVFDNTLREISILNSEKYSINTSSGEKNKIFDELSQFISDSSQRDNFCRALISKLVDFSFEDSFNRGFDFFAPIFEYLIKDYNSDSGGKYAEYFTPHAVSRIMADILVDKSIYDVSVYDPSAGSGTLLMSLANKIGQDKCSIYAEDISQKSSNLLRLNLILNNLILSIPNIVKTNTILHPFYLDRKFDFIVSNPPFKLDFSDYRHELEKDTLRFFAGIPNILKKEKEKMAIYLLFLQHVIFSLSDKGKAAIVVPTGFLTAQSSIEKSIRRYLIDGKYLSGVISMPSNIFANTGTNVSILFLDRNLNTEQIILIDASKLGQKVKDGNKQKTLLNKDEEQQIINTFKNREKIEDFSIVVTADEIKQKNYSFSAGQYFDIKIDYVDITAEQFKQKMLEYQNNLENLFAESARLEQEIKEQLQGLKFE